jgi:hypothetical protein
MEIKGREMGKRYRIDGTEERVVEEMSTDVPETRDFKPWEDDKAIS